MTEYIVTTATTVWEDYAVLADSPAAARGHVWAALRGEADLPPSRDGGSSGDTEVIAVRERGSNGDAA